ncbi:hypothetical protein NIES4106_61320 (plasmid) [Fischerella sp. NIES-4106]|nr:hypothetical protein NIES4106_61320 [Fischerella sp. NIES-4106]
MNTTEQPQIPSIPGTQTPLNMASPILLGALLAGAIVLGLDALSRQK